MVFIWALHIHPQHHSFHCQLPKCPVLPVSAHFEDFLYIYVIVPLFSLCWFRNSVICYDTCFPEPSILLLLLLSHFLQLCGFVSFWKFLYSTFSEISGSKTRYTSSTHSLNLECSTIPQHVGCSWGFFCFFFSWQTPLSCMTVCPCQQCTHVLDYRGNSEPAPRSNPDLL